MTYFAIQFTHPWLRRFFTPTAVSQTPQPDYTQQIADLRSDLATLRADHAKTREELAGETAHRVMLQGICGRQDNELVSISTALTATQANLQQAMRDKHFQSEQIRALQLEVVELRTQLNVANEQTAMHIQIRQALQLANDELKRENAQMYAKIHTHVEGENGE